MHQHLLFEIGCEELPAKGLAALGEQLLNHLESLLTKAKLEFTPGCYFASPRRLGVFIPHCQAMQADLWHERKGPKLSQAFKPDGTPTPAALGFAKSCGVSFEQLSNDGECLLVKQLHPGKATLALLPELLNQAVSLLAIPRPMRWGSRDTAFLRPVKWILALFGEQIVPMECLSVKADRFSYGHRFMNPRAIAFASADLVAYEQCLTDAFVIANFEKRQAIITSQITLAAKKAFGHAVIDPALLTEVTGLVEWPQALVIPFDERFLNLPPEALIASMQNHQKCFAIKTEQGHLQPNFITISNINSKDPLDVIKGNARVMHARLSDAEFFYEQDRQVSLKDYRATLEKMTFQRDLGSMQDRVDALIRLTGFIAPKLGADKILAEQSAALAKSDLCSQMVSEFPELQGIMGRTYALLQTYPPEVALALEEQYLPRFAGDALPISPMGASLALADRLLMLTGIFGIGQIPTGDKDPFALRRAALGVIRIILSQAKELSLTTLIKESVARWQVNFQQTETAAKVYDFIVERLRYFWLEHEAFSHVARDPLNKAIEATTHNIQDLPDGYARLTAVLAFQTLSEADALASANKRVNNLLMKEKFDTSVTLPIQANLFEFPAEHDLFNQLTCCQIAMQALLDEKNYVGALQQLAVLKNPIDAFFNDVMVLIDDTKLRHNRLSLLNALRRLLCSVADLSCL